jgi:hypothetical protein
MTILIPMCHTVLFGTDINGRLAVGLLVAGLAALTGIILLFRWAWDAVVREKFHTVLLFHVAATVLGMGAGFILSSWFSSPGPFLLGGVFALMVGGMIFSRAFWDLVEEVPAAIGMAVAASAAGFLAWQILPVSIFGCAMGFVMLVSAMVLFASSWDSVITESQWAKRSYCISAVVFAVCGGLLVWNVFPDPHWGWILGAGVAAVVFLILSHVFAEEAQNVPAAGAMLLAAACAGVSFWWVFSFAGGGTVLWFKWLLEH